MSTTLHTTSVQAITTERPTAGPNPQAPFPLGLTVGVTTLLMVMIVIFVIVITALLVVILRAKQRARRLSSCRIPTAVNVAYQITAQPSEDALLSAYDYPAPGHVTSYTMMYNDVYMRNQETGMRTCTNEFRTD